MAKRHYTPRALVPLAERIQNGIIPVTECGCWIWMGQLDDNGYGFIKTSGKNVRVHRVSWETFVGAIPPKMKVLHQCDIRCCANPDHLFLGTQFDNMRDMIRKGRGPNLNGEINPNSKLTSAQALAIKNSPLGCAELGRVHKISASMASNIKLGKNWTHL